MSDPDQWHGVNTLEELEIADKLKSQK